MYILLPGRLLLWALVGPVRQRSVVEVLLAREAPALPRGLSPWKVKRHSCEVPARHMSCKHYPVAYISVIITCACRAWTFFEHKRLLARERLGLLARSSKQSINREAENRGLWSADQARADIITYYKI